ncbi:hypothetical protein WJX72_001568 [[Myrmecia] bisecta]|uniref:Protein BCCIP homolog n=1 Tax=[Myrmecia] bisecta TaxID=41462 RepID=A0AAW1Q6L1_9CHLO
MKRAEPASSASRESTASSSSEDDYDQPSADSEQDVSDLEETVEVNLEFFDPQEKDFQGLRALLQTYLDGEPYNCSELVDAIIKQPRVGSVVKTDAGEAPLGVTSVLNLTWHAQLAALAEVKQYLLARCPDPQRSKLLLEAWSAPKTGLVVSERLINCPPELAPPLQQALFDEISWATEDEPSQALRDSFRFEQFILLSRVYADPAPRTDRGGSTKRQKCQPEIVYTRPEDQFFHAHCEWSYTFPVMGRPAARDELQQLRLVCAVKASKIATVRAELDRAVGNVANTANLHA